MASTSYPTNGHVTSWEAGRRRLGALRSDLAEHNGKLLQEGHRGNRSSASASANGNLNDPHLAASGSIISSNRLTASRIRDFSANALDGQPGVYTQRKALASTPGTTQDLRLSLSYKEYGLPNKLVSNLKSMGINLIYPWQANCLLRHHGVLSGTKNLVYSASTGAGKSLVADILMLKRVLDANQKAILILPYVALVQEKLRWLRKAVDGIERNVELAVPGAFRGYEPGRTVRVVPFYGNSKIRSSLRCAVFRLPLPWVC